MQTRIITKPFLLSQPDEPFTAVRLGKLFRCRCDVRLLQGVSVGIVQQRLRRFSIESGFSVIGDHADLYGETVAERETFGWTINLTYAQSGGSFDSWHEEKTVDVNLHWCDEDKDDGSPSKCIDFEQALLRGVEKLFSPERAVYWPRIYGPLTL